MIYKLYLIYDTFCMGILLLPDVARIINAYFMKDLTRKNIEFL